MSIEMSDVRVSDQNGVRWISLHRPASKNGLTIEVNSAIIGALGGAAELPAIRVVVLTGSEGNFCSGLDLKAAMSNPSSMEDMEPNMRKYFHGMIRAVQAVDKPVIALVDGAAVGYGCDLALACDLRIGTERTKMGEVFSRRGLMPDGGGTFFLPRLVGVGKALELMFTGDVIDAAEALRIGLINRQVESAGAEAETRALAERLAAGPPLVLAAIKRAVHKALSSTLDEALEAEVEGQMKLIRSKDFFEGVTAFFQKRAPVFIGE